MTKIIKLVVDFLSAKGLTGSRTKWIAIALFVGLDVLKHLGILDAASYDYAFKGLVAAGLLTASVHKE